MSKGNTGNYSGPYSRVTPIPNKGRDSRADGRKPTSTSTKRVVGQVDCNSGLSGPVSTGKVK
jgi:hypothetical protein